MGWSPVGTRKPAPPSLTGARSRSTKGKFCTDFRSDPYRADPVVGTEPLHTLGPAGDGSAERHVHIETFEVNALTKMIP